MEFPSTIICLVAILVQLGTSVPTWPSAVDELEDVMYLNTGYKSRGLAIHVTPCSFSEFGPGRQTAAEWLRLGFHDMATANIFFEPRGGIDASIGFELNNGENVGAALATSLNTYGGFINNRLSMADMIALGVHSSVRACGGPLIPMRGGRIDATAAGPLGVPQPQNGQSTFKNQFARMGFSTTEMIQMVACGHTLGGVHSAEFPDIVPPGTAPDGFQLFDTSTSFDNSIAVQYINGPNSDPLSVGSNPGKNSDLAVFSADQNITLKAMQDAATFNAMCSGILQKMIELVPNNVTLSDVIAPYDVKPSGIQLTLLGGGTRIRVSGEIRVRTTTRSAAQISKVQVIYKDKIDAADGTILASAIGAAAGYDESFSFYGFNFDLPVKSSISSFIVIVTTTAGVVETYSNNGAGFPLQDSIIVQTPQSCLSEGNLTIVAAARSGIAAPVLTITQRIARTGDIPMPRLVNNTINMVKGTIFGPYSLYSASFPISSATGTKYDVSSGSFTDSFKDAAELGRVCTPLGSASPSSSTLSTRSTPATSTTVPTSASTVSTLLPSQTLGHSPLIGAYTFQGCFTEGNGVRALTGAFFPDYKDMSVGKCASNCAGFTYFGVEYGGECYCGATLATSSKPAPIGDCNFVCPGSKFEYCGAGNRLELYKLTSQISSTSTSSLTPTSLSTRFSASTSRSTTVLSASGTSKSSSRSSISVSSTYSLTTLIPAPTLHIVPSVGLYNYAGCYTEGNGVRALSAAFFPSDIQSIESCVMSCSGYKMAGAEYGRECWCADSLGTGSTLVANGECSMTCAGDKYQYCGAGNRLTVYIKNGTVSGGSSKTLATLTIPFTSVSSTISAPAIKTKVGSYNYYDCQIDGIGVRVLSGASYYDCTAMTLELCAKYCNGFEYWGVEYGGECTVEIALAWRFSMQLEETRSVASSVQGIHQSFVAPGIG